jgi:oligoendopeptidase F
VRIFISTGELQYLLHYRLELYPAFLGVARLCVYAFGETLVWSLYARYQAEGGDFSSRYLEALSKGGAVHPNELVAPLGINLQDPRFWHDGLQLMEDMVAQAEEEAAQL